MPLLVNVAPSCRLKFPPLCVIVFWLISVVPDRYLWLVPVIPNGPVLVNVPLPLIVPPSKVKPFPPKANVTPPLATVTVAASTLIVPLIVPESVPETVCV